MKSQPFKRSFKNLTCLTVSACLLLMMLVCCVYSIEEEIHVEKEQAQASAGRTTSHTNPTMKDIPSENERMNHSKKTKKKRKPKRFMKDLRKLPNSWFDSDPWSNSFMAPSSTGRSLGGNMFGNSLFNDFDNMFSNFDRSFNSMKRRMKNMMTRSTMLPSLVDDHQWWEDYTNSVNTNKNFESSTSESSNVMTDDKTLKRRGPISSIIKTVNQDGKNELSLDITNVPRDVFEKKDIEIKVKENSFGDLITIRGEKKMENGHFEFSKSFRFPKGSLDLDRVKATLSDDGTLSVKIPRIDEQVPIPEKVKQISIE